MTGSKRYIPFTYKMMIPYLALVLLTDILIGYISYAMLIQSRTEIAESSVKTSMEQASNSIRYQMDEMQRMTETLFGSISFQRALQKEGTPLEMYLTMLDEIDPQLTAPLQFFGNNIRITLFTVNEKQQIVEDYGMVGNVIGKNYFVRPLQEIANQEWFNRINHSREKNIWMQAGEDANFSNLSHFRRLVSYSDYRTTIGYLQVTASLEEMLGVLNSFPVQEGITLRLINREAGNIMYQYGPVEGEAGNGDFLTLQEDIADTGFYIQTLVPGAYLTKDAGVLRLNIILICTASFVVMALIGLIVARISGRKMSKIVVMLRSIQEGNFQKRIRINGNDEFVQIAGAFNEMARGMQSLIDSVYEQGKQKKQAELEALQAQINPHFLYNTLSTISSLANLGEIGKVTHMVQGLSRFYRLTLNEGNVNIPLQQELEQVSTYLDIQRVRYADAFKVYMEIEPEIQHVQIIKLIVQPFVENIFKHAWFGETIAIRITARKVDDRIELKIIDNGIGMKPEKVQELMNAPASSGGYGVKNVYERIRLRYGDRYGGEIASIYGAGTTVRLWLPAEMPDENEGNSSRANNKEV
ncbi:sensor with HAMP domain protein [Paenibacillus oryzae]|uniref:Sensor with HAMP domain protein n=1 Tax=Paenibacillus oryzae TaxID=1844972 RepID=A0A1A5YJD7_9BACL|nr:sensor histidine kinase [Paenibacillus oryzae]OBR65505.1 sensor with HAMP domain protein [Paenibacillus oryzae]